MREIKFRGKDIDEERGWRYGSLERDLHQKKYYIIDEYEGLGRKVIKETIRTVYRTKR